MRPLIKVNFEGDALVDIPLNPNCLSFKLREEEKSRNERPIIPSNPGIEKLIKVKKGVHHHQKW